MCGLSLSRQATPNTHFVDRWGWCHKETDPLPVKSSPVQIMDRLRWMGSGSSALTSEEARDVGANLAAFAQAWGGETNRITL